MLWVVSTQSGVLHVLVCTITLCIYIIWTCQKKLHTCEEGGEQLRISFWHLSIGELEKQLFTKNVEVGQ